MLGYFGHRRRDFVLRIVVPIFAAAIILNIVAAGLLYWSTAQADRIATDRQRALADLVVSQLRGAIAHDQESVTVWDDAVVAVRNRDAEWIDVNLGSWMNTYFGHDAAYILNPDDAAIYASVNGAVVEPDRFATLWTRALPLVENLRRRLREGDEEGISDRVLTIGASDLSVIGGRPAIVSVKPIVSDTGEIAQVPGEEFLHIAVRYLDDSLVEELRATYLLDGLHFSWSLDNMGQQTASALYNSSGEAVGYFVWTPYRPGSTVFGHVWPILLALFLMGTALLAALLFVLRRRSLSLNKTQAEITHLATHDMLTGLANRTQFESSLGQALSLSVSRQKTVALLYLDLDRFKEVNDTLGHPAGDGLLKEFADRLRHLTGPEDTIARIGGDEFTIVLCGERDIAGIEQLCTSLVESARQPFAVEDNQVFIGVSIGAAVAPGDGVTAADLTRKADIALYSAKTNGRSGFAIFSPGMETLLTERRELERDLRLALKTPEQFEVHYQPLFAAQSRDVVGVEALLRWKHPSRGLVRPDIFIPLAEETGLIERLGELVLERACAAATRWPIETIAINVSAVEMKSPTYAIRVANILMATGLDPRRLELEVTETAMSDKDGNCQRTVAALRDLGVRFALDDFGTGFSSLGRLQQLEVDRIKIDRSFVNGFGSDNGDEAIVRAIVDLAKATGLRTTAEGVETVEQGAFLSEIGCDELQGFLLAKPLPAAQLEEVFSSQPKTRRRQG